MIDFQRDFGVNAGYVQALFEEWTSDPGRIDESWRALFEKLHARVERNPAGVMAAAEKPPDRLPAETVGEVEALSGLAGRIAENMQQSLELPTATSVRSISAKLLDENRRILNEHLTVRAYAKASYTHLLAFALVRALREMPRLQSVYEERDGKPFRRVPSHINLGLAIDVAGRGGRSLVVPCLRAAESRSFAEFHQAYEDLVLRGREGKLEAADFRGTTVTLTNPGGFGTTLSVPRLMKGQGLIVATGSIGFPPELLGMARASLAELAMGPVVTLTSTYDHRVIQGAESGLLLKRIDELMQGASGFYEEIFAAFRVPWAPHQGSTDQRSPGERDNGELQARVWELINAYRHRGCRLADLDPLVYQPDRDPSLDPASYGFTVWDLDREYLCGNMLGRRTMPLREILGTLRRAYCRRWTVESMHITSKEKKHWIREQVENPAREHEFDESHRLRVLEFLVRAENFERFLHSKYVGNKRFSLEGGDSLIPALAEILDRAAEQGVERVVLGMAHRGRLNVLANIMGKSYEQIFREFESVLLPLSSEGSGDVKYHLGQKGSYQARCGRSVEVVLSANPSHLEAVDPVVCGMARAYQDSIGDHQRKRVLAVLIHGDAAFSGQGVVAETLNMSQLRAYRCGGTLHLIVNNQIGFTAGPVDLKSTEYCTDTAKSVQAPIFHANGDFPESVLRAARIAVDYQREFSGDVVLDIVCYRRWGHNEGDEPAYTQPTLYSRIRAHPTVRENYTRLSIRRGWLSAESAKSIAERLDAELSSALDSFRKESAHEAPGDFCLLDSNERAKNYQDSPALQESAIATTTLVQWMDRLNAMPEGFLAHPNLLRQLHRREQMVRGERPVDWGCAEALAFASLLQAGVSIRLAGQDSGRGTFSHRHAVVHDQSNDREHIPLAHFARECGASFEVFNSLLSEEAALGFEYGYSLAREKTLVLWEAQFGDFANGAQIQIDQFILPGQAKWRQESSLVLLLPHGFDGQGPEHSSARPERFLAACAGGNAVVANCSTAAQYYHLLRRQGLTLERRPLILFTPKSLLRELAAASRLDEFCTGTFQELLLEVQPAGPGTRKVLLCTGKIYHELAEARRAQKLSDLSILRLEQLYPLPRAALLRELQRAPNAEWVWVQEEPRNMGAWPYLLQCAYDLGLRLTCVARAEAASPATGSYRRHQLEQEALIARALA